MEEWQRVYAEKGGEALADLLRGSRTLEDEQKPLDDAQLEKLVPHRSEDV